MQQECLIVSHNHSADNCWRHPSTQSSRTAAANIRPLKSKVWAINTVLWLEVKHERRRGGQEGTLCWVLLLNLTRNSCFTFTFWDSYCNSLLAEVQPQRLIQNSASTLTSPQNSSLLTPLPCSPHWLLRSKSTPPYMRTRPTFLSGAAWVRFSSCWHLTLPVPPCLVSSVGINFPRTSGHKSHFSKSFLSLSLHTSLSVKSSLQSIFLLD